MKHTELTCDEVSTLLETSTVTFSVLNTEKVRTLKNMKDDYKGDVFILFNGLDDFQKDYRKKEKMFDDIIENCLVLINDCLLFKNPTYQETKQTTTFDEKLKEEFVKIKIKILEQIDKI